MDTSTNKPAVCVLHEPFVGAVGLPADCPFVSIKGDTGVFTIYVGPNSWEVRAIAWVHAMIQTGPLRAYLPAHWQKFMDGERNAWQPLALGNASTRSCKASRCCTASRAIICAMPRSRCPRASDAPRATATVPISCARTIFPEVVRFNTP